MLSLVIKLLQDKFAPTTHLVEGQFLYVDLTRNKGISRRFRLGAGTLKIFMEKGTRI